MELRDGLGPAEQPKQHELGAQCEA
jgi:hypothetical protein